MAHFSGMLFASADFCEEDPAPEVVQKSIQLVPRLEVAKPNQCVLRASILLSSGVLRCAFKTVRFFDIDALYDM